MKKIFILLLVFSTLFSQAQGVINNFIIKTSQVVVDALVNEGVSKAGLEDYYGAIDSFNKAIEIDRNNACLLYTSPSPRD